MKRSARQTISFPPSAAARNAATMTGRMGVPMPGMGAGPSLSKIMFDKYDKVTRRPCPRTDPIVAYAC